ncbi:transcription termination factor Rho [candidate division WWE3 bacterium]|nr:transcription termination factor Rho [candidate division WWE3 bacterium]
MPQRSRSSNSYSNSNSNSSRSFGRNQPSFNSGGNSHNNSRSYGNNNNDSGRFGNRSTSFSQNTQTQAQGYQAANYGSGGYTPSSNYGSNYGGDDLVGTFSGDTVPVQGMLEILPDYGVVRQPEQLDETLPKDVYTSLSQIRRFGLRTGDIVTGQARPPKDNERWLSLLKVEKVNGLDPDQAKARPHFSKLTPIFPDEWLKLETKSEVLSTRLIDLVAPIGKGQRAMIVAPPKAGKTWLLQDIAAGIAENHPDITLMVCLIGERPEEVTDMRRKVKGEVFASNFDEPSEVQTRIAELTLEKAKRLVEKGEDVVILMDSLTRLARAYNLVVEPSGRTLSGGFDPSALYPPKHFFGAARNVEFGGSLTIIATALVETGSRMDDVIFEEFKGTGNSELRLDRSLAERRVYPSIDIKASSTRNEDKLYSKEDYTSVILLHRMIDLLNDNEVTEMVTNRMKKSKTNAEFLKSLRDGGK